MTPVKRGNQIKLASYYPPEIAEQLQRLSEVTRVPLAVYMREAAEDLLKKYQAELRKARR